MSINHYLDANIQPKLDLYAKNLSVDGSFVVTNITADSIDVQTTSTVILNGGIDPDITVNSNLDLGGTKNIDNCNEIDAVKVSTDELVSRRTYNPNNILFSNPIGSKIVITSFFAGNTDAILQLSREEKIENPSGNRIEVLTYTGSFKSTTIAINYDVYFDVIFLAQDQLVSWTPGDFRGTIKTGDQNQNFGARVVGYIQDVTNLTTQGVRLNFKNSNLTYTTPYANIDFTFSVYRFI